MKLIPAFVALLALCCTAALFPELGAQSLSNSLGFSINGSFLNGTAESSDSILIIDNNLTNGYKNGFDLVDSPTALNPTGPEGSAAFQWGSPASSSPTFQYLHPSAIWFQPQQASDIAPEQSFQLGKLFYRNGTIQTNTGATSVEMALTLSFAPPLGMDPISVTLGSQLVNTKNTSDQIAGADIVSLRDNVTPLDFQDTYGNRYYMELTFQVDQDTIDGTLSSRDEFRVFEGGQGSATMLGRFTTSPAGFNGTLLVPEPSTALLGGIGMLILIRRKR